MAKYTIHDISFNATYQCPDDVLILDQAEEMGLDYPYSDRAGASSTSIALLLSGTVIDEGFFLTDRSRQAGFFHTDSSYPQSDLEIVSLGMEELEGIFSENPDKFIIDYSGPQVVLKPR